MVRRLDQQIPVDKDRLVEIYLTAAQIFHQQGFDATSMSDIAEGVNLTKAGLYYYISSKEELLNAIMDYAMTLLQDRVVTPSSNIEDPQDRLEFCIEEHSRLVMGDAKVLSILTDEMAGLSQEHQKQIRERKRVYFDLIRDTLDMLIAEGKMSPRDTTVAAFSIFGAIMWLPRWYDPRGSKPDEHIIAELKRSILYGVLGTK